MIFVMQLLRYYHLVLKYPDKNNYQLDIFKDKIFAHIFTVYPKIMPLMPSKDKLKCWKIPYVLQYHGSNKELYTED